MNIVLIDDASIKNYIKGGEYYMDLMKFFEENDVILEYKVYKFRNKRKRGRNVQPHIPAHAPRIIKDIADVFKLFYHNGISIKQVDYPLFIAVIQRYLGYTKDWSYTIASCICFILAVTEGRMKW